MFLPKPSKEGHAISPTYTSEPEPATEDAWAESGDIFGTPPPARPAKKAKAAKPIKRIFAISRLRYGDIPILKTL